MSDDDPGDRPRRRLMFVSSLAGWFFWVTIRILLRTIAYLSALTGELGEILTGTAFSFSSTLTELAEVCVRVRSDGREVGTSRDLAVTPSPSRSVTFQEPPVVDPLMPNPRFLTPTHVTRPRFSFAPEGSVHVTYETQDHPTCQRVPTTIEELPHDSSVTNPASSVSRSTQTLSTVVRGRRSAPPRLTSPSGPSSSLGSLSHLERTLADFVPPPATRPPRRRSPRTQVPPDTIQPT